MISHATCKVLVAIVAVILLAGCTFPSQSHHEIHFDGPVERVEGSFHMQGQVDISLGAAPHRNFTDVQVVLYDQDQCVQNRVALGDMSTDPSVAPRQRAVNITTDDLPTYVLIESPDFWEGNLPVVAYRWTGERYERYFINNEREKFSKRRSSISPSRASRILVIDCVRS